MLLSYIHSTELSIYSYALSSKDSLCQSRDFNRLESLLSCLTALEAYFKVFLSFTPQQFISFTTSTLLQVTYCLFCLYTITSVDDPAWDRSEISKRVDLIAICRQISQNFRDAAVCAGFQGDEEDTFTRLGINIDSAMRHWRSLLESQGHAQGISGNEEISPHPGDLTMGLSEELWLTDLLAPVVDWL